MIGETVFVLFGQLHRLFHHYLVIFCRSISFQPKFAALRVCLCISHLNVLHNLLSFLTNCLTVDALVIVGLLIEKFSAS